MKLEDHWNRWAMNNATIRNSDDHVRSIMKSSFYAGALACCGVLSDDKEIPVVTWNYQEFKKAMHQLTEEVKKYIDSPT